MSLFLTLTFCLILSINEAFLLPREVNYGNPVKVAVKIKSHENDDNQQKSHAMPKNAQEESKFLTTLLQAFASHQKFVNLWVSLMKAKPVSGTGPFGPFTPRAWLEMKKGH